MTLSPELQFQKSQLMLLAGEIRQMAMANSAASVVDKWTSQHAAKLDQAAGILLNVFQLGGFCDPLVGGCIGEFIAGHIEDYLSMRWQAKDNFNRLLSTLLQDYWYPKGIDVAIRYDNDGRTLTETGAIQRWYQETVDNANLLEYLSTQIGLDMNLSTGEYKTCLLKQKNFDLCKLEATLGAVAAIACQDHRFLRFVNTSSDFLQACYPYEENEARAAEIFTEILSLVTAKVSTGSAINSRNISEPTSSEYHYDPNIELTNRIDSGLYGVVWEAIQTDLNRKVAVKIIKPDMAHRASALAHARALARVSHPNLVTVHAVAKVSCPGISHAVEGIVMEWIEGDKLANRIAGSFSAAEFVKLSSEILDAVNALHMSGIAHGDLHAGNAIVTSDSIKIIDIDATNEYSIGRVTSVEKSDLMQSDINGAAWLVRQIVRKSILPAQLIESLDNDLRAASSIIRIRELIKAVT